MVSVPGRHDGSGLPSARFGQATMLRPHTVSLSSGTHQVTCARGCGIEVYGWGEAVSYLYPGGLDVREIVD